MLNTKSEKYKTVPQVKAQADIKMLKLNEKEWTEDRLSDSSYLYYDLEGVRYRSVRPLSAGAIQFYFFIMTLYMHHQTDAAESNHDYVAFTVKDWMNATEKTNSTCHRENVIKYLDALYTLSMDIKGIGECRLFWKVYPDREDRLTANEFRIYFTEEMKKLLNMFTKSTCKFYQIPSMLFKLNNKQHPYAFSLGTYICFHKRANIGKGRGKGCHEDIHKLSTLIELCNGCGMPSLEQVRASNRNITDRIITPFRRDMDVFKDNDIFNYSFCSENGTTICNDFDLAQMDIKDLMNVNVMINWISEPDYTELKKQKADCDKYAAQYMSRKKKKQIRNQIDHIDHKDQTANTDQIGSNQ